LNPAGFSVSKLVSILAGLANACEEISEIEIPMNHQRNFNSDFFMREK